MESVTRLFTPDVAIGAHRDCAFDSSSNSSSRERHYGRCVLILKTVSTRLSVNIMRRTFAPETIEPSISYTRRQGFGDGSDGAEKM
jgi:hypothetical protein